jgi:hypothetical protein
MIVTTRFRLACLIAATALVIPPAVAQEDRSDRLDGGARSPSREEPETLNLGIQLTPRLLDTLLDKAARRLVKDYGFDEYQHEQVRQLLHEHVPRFLKEHQTELQQLLNDYLEAIAAEEPPDPEFAAEWAQQALPIVDEFRGMVRNFSTDMREFLTDDQEVLLDGYLAVVDTGTRFATGRLQEFADGGFDPEVHWPRGRRFKEDDPARMRELRREMEAARAVAMSASAPVAPRAAREAKPGAPKLAADANARQVRAAAKTDKDEWTRYVEWFIRRYRLNNEQQQKAYSLLQQQLDRRDRYFLSRTREMERIEKMFSQAKTDEQTQLAESAYQKLFAPAGRMFDQLKEKLERLPTRQQRRVAALADQPDQGKERPPRRPSRTGAAAQGRPSAGP